MQVPVEEEEEEEDMTKPAGRKLRPLFEKRESGNYYYSLFISAFMFVTFGLSINRFKPFNLALFTTI